MEPIIDDNKCRVYLINNFLNDNECDQLLKEIKLLPFERKDIVVYGKTWKMPRMTCSVKFGEYKTYTYNKVEEKPVDAGEYLTKLKNNIEGYLFEVLKLDDKFNFALLNYYKDGNDSVSAHSDSESSIRINSPIASISLGQSREFILKNKFIDETIKDETIKINLENGSLLLMLDKTQQLWTHAINKSKKELKERWNITFRCLN